MNLHQDEIGGLDTKLSGQTFKLSRSFESPVSLLDFDRVIAVFRGIMSEWRDRVTTHLRVGEDSAALPEDVTHIRNIIERLGGFYELDYMAATVPNEFTVTADFSTGQFRFRSRSSELLTRLVESWERVRRELDISKDLLDLAIPREGKKFILSCVNEDGSLSESRGKAVTLHHAYVVPALKRLEMEPVARKFSDYLTRVQNKDGGWGFKPGDKSKILPTASASLVLMSVDSNIVSIRSESVKRGIDFLATRQNANGSWGSRSEEKGLASIIVVSVLRRSGEYDDLVTKSLAFIRKWLKKISLIDYDIIVLEILKEIAVIKSIVDKAIKRRYEKLLASAEDYDAFLRKANIVNITTLANLMLLSGINTEDSRFRSALDVLLRNRNINDWGWPLSQGGASELYPTILSLIVFKSIASRS